MNRSSEWTITTAYNAIQWRRISIFNCLLGNTRKQLYIKSSLALEMTPQPKQTIICKPGSWWEQSYNIIFIDRNGQQYWCAKWYQNQSAPIINYSKNVIKQTCVDRWAFCSVRCEVTFKKPKKKRIYNTTNNNNIIITSSRMLFFASSFFFVFGFVLFRRFWITKIFLLRRKMWNISLVLNWR